LPKGSKMMDVYLPENANLQPQYHANLLGGITSLTGEVRLRKTPEHHGMYRQIGQTKWTSYTSRFVPYFTWGNRTEGEMTVFLPIIWE
ncbi:MAG: glycoside hydrolase family 127 protein, partial [Bacteroidota bacterium]